MSEELTRQIEELRRQLDELKATEEENLEAVTEATESDGDPEETPVEVEDFTDDDPKGELAAAQAAILKEVALLRQSVTDSQENADKIRTILQRQGYSI